MSEGKRRALGQMLDLSQEITRLVETHPDPCGDVARKIWHQSRALDLLARQFAEGGFVA